MTLKKKLVFFIAGSGIFFSILYLWLNHMTIFHSQSEQKRIFTSKVASRVSMVIENEKKRITTICFDWAAWDVMYAYAEKPTREFESQSMPAAVIPEYDLNLVIIMNRERWAIYHEGYDRTARRPIQFTPGKQQNEPFWENIAVDFDQPSLRSFVSDSEHGPMIMVSAPILHSDARGPMNGRVVMGRMVNADFNRRIGAAIQEKTKLLRPEQAADLFDAEQRRQLRLDNFCLKESKDLLRIFCAYADPAGRTAFLVQVDSDKTLFNLQEKAAGNFLLALWLITVLYGSLFFWAIDRMLLKRLKDISRKTSDITTFEDLSIRIPEDQHDELAQLGHNINKMLERLENENVRRQEMDNRLLMNEKLVATGRLAANIAHEINNPLFAIANSLAVIKGHLKNARSDVREVLTLSENEIARVRKITRKLLDYGKINLETFKESDIDAIMDTACDVLKLSQLTRNTVIARERRDGERPIFCNPDSLQQVFMNLILNASEAMDGAGEIAIGVTGGGDAYEIHFRDTGPGFADDIKKRIFEPFNSSKDAKGAGLGLYISYHIIKRHGGSMTLDDSCRSGSHLVVTLPRRRGRNMREKPRLLIVDDDPEVRKSLQIWLRNEGFTVFVAANESQARDVLKSEDIALCLVDLRLKNEDGLRLAGELKALDEQLKIIVITGYPTYETAIAAMKTGIFDYLSKSTDNDAILRKINAAVEERERDLARAGGGGQSKYDVILIGHHQLVKEGLENFFKENPEFRLRHTYHSYEYINKSDFNLEAALLLICASCNGDFLQDQETFFGRLKIVFPNARAVIINCDCDDDRKRELIRRGVKGFLPANISKSQLKKALGCILGRPDLDQPRSVAPAAQRAAG